MLYCDIYKFNKILFVLIIICFILVKVNVGNIDSKIVRIIEVIG